MYLLLKTEACKACLARLTRGLVKIMQKPEVLIANMGTPQACTSVASGHLDEALTLARGQVEGIPYLSVRIVDVTNSFLIGDCKVPFANNAERLEIASWKAHVFLPRLKAGVSSGGGVL
jgi:hypothetical protein